MFFIRFFFKYDFHFVLYLTITTPDLNHNSFKGYRMSSFQIILVKNVFEKQIKLE